MISTTNFFLSLSLSFFLSHTHSLVKTKVKKPSQKDKADYIYKLDMCTSSDIKTRAWPKKNPINKQAPEILYLLMSFMSIDNSTIILWTFWTDSSDQKDRQNFYNLNKNKYFLLKKKLYRQSVNDIEAIYRDWKSRWYSKRINNILSGIYIFLIKKRVILRKAIISFFLLIICCDKIWLHLFNFRIFGYSTR